MFFFVLASCATTEAPESDNEHVSDEPETVTEIIPPVETEVTEIFVPTETEYRQTFVQVEEIISELNRLIRERRFEEWLGYLTDEYRATLSDPAFLKEASERPALKNRGVVLSNLRDYFINVVVPSRANLRLDDLVFVSADSVEAIMEIQDSRITLYYLVLQNGVWKIGSF